MITLMLKVLFFISCLSFSLGLSSSNKSIHKKKNKTQQSRTQKSLTSKNLRLKAVQNSNRKTASSRITTSPCQFKKYPKPPKDKSKLPKPIQCYVEAIADLCKIDSFEEQLQSMEVILKGLREAVTFYTTKHRRFVDTWAIHSVTDNLIEDVHMRVVWKPMLAKQHRMDVVGQFLLVHNDLYNLPEPAKEDIVILAHDWAEPIYRGLHCLTTGSRTKERIIIY